MAHPLRDYGLPDTTVEGAPRVRRLVTEDRMRCPSCSCATLAEIEVTATNPLLRGGRGRGLYLSCPACPWAGPCALMATPEEPATKGDA